MPSLIRKVITANQDSVTLSCANMSKFGFGITGNWVGTVNFSYSLDGINFAAYPQGGPLNAFPFAPVGTAAQVAVSSVTGNGNWEGDVKNFLAVRATFVRTSGSVSVAIGASTDLSYQDAFLGSTSTFVSQPQAGGGQNVMTIAAQPNRGWRCRTLTASFSGVPGSPPLVTISDGGSATLWSEYASDPSGTGTYKVNLPDDPRTPGLSGGGVYGTPGNNMVITIAAPGGTITSIINAEMIVM